jgi:hypothetical protein
MAEKPEIVRDIAAPPEAVYAAISDVTRMGEWSEECYACVWRDAVDGPAVGAPGACWAWAGWSGCRATTWPPIRPSATTRRW